MKYLVFLSALLFTSCFLMPLPAPKTHIYKEIENGNIRSIEIFCTPRNKHYIIYCDNEDLNMEIYSKVLFQGKPQTLYRSDFFGKMVYQTGIIISDRKFHRLFLNDTITIFDKNSGEQTHFLPIY